MEEERKTPVARIRVRPGAWKLRTAMAAALLFVIAGCAAPVAQAPPASEPRPAQRPTAGTHKVDGAQVQRLQQIMVPLIQKMNRPLPLDQVRVTVIDNPQINAANAGGGEFYVTTGLLQKASDDQLRGVLAHEVAHADLGHLAKIQLLGTGVNLGMVLLDQLFPGSSALTPLVADLAVMKPFSRGEEYEADAHGVEILSRAGYNGRQIMAGTLNWLIQTSGPSGGFFATHPGTQDRIDRVLAMR